MTPIARGESETTKPVRAVQNIPTRFAIIKRAEKIIKEVDGFFEDAANFGLSVEEADPRGELVAIRKGLIAMLERERRINNGRHSGVTK